MQIIFCLFSLLLLLQKPILATEGIYLRVNLNTVEEKTVELNSNARSELSMLFLPPQEVTTRLQIKAKSKTGPTDKENVFFNENTVESADLQYYSTGQPNQKMDQAIVNELLWTGGIGVQGVTITSELDQFGSILNQKNVPDKYLRYFKHNLLLFPEKELKEGDSWSRNLIQPMVLTPDKEVFDVCVDILYTLSKIDKANDFAEISIKMDFKKIEDPQNLKSDLGTFSMTKTGIIKVKISDGMPFKSTYSSAYTIAYPNNYSITTEEILEASVSNPTKTNLDK